MSLFTLDTIVSVLSRLCLFLLSVFIITHASRRVVKEEKDKASEQEEGVQTLAWCHVVTFPILGSVMLLIMFYFFEYIQFILTLLTLVLSVITIFVFISPFLHGLISALQGGQRHTSRMGVISVDWTVTLTIFFAISLSLMWLLTGHWLLLDLVGVASATFMITFVRIPNLKVATVFLILLLVYDVFWVFLSSSMFTSNVMVEVATKKAKNPVAVVAEKINMHSFAESQPALALPGKIIIPSSFSEENYSMLGLGDIVLPGMLLCMAMRFDSLSSITPMSNSHCGPTCQLKFQKVTYFAISLIGYTIGLVLANLMAQLFQYPQPAMLYLVPCILLPFISKSYVQGHLGALWHGPFTNTVNGSKLPV